MATELQQRKFERASKRILDTVENIDDRTARAVKQELVGLRARIAERILNETDFNQFVLSSLFQSVRGEFENFATDMDQIIDDDVRRAFDFGVKSVDEPLKAAGADLQVGAIPMVSTDVIAAQVERNTAFITNLSTEAANRINTEIRLAVTGEQTPFQAMKRIGNVGIERSTFKSIVDRAEAIARTEINSALNTATTMRARQAAEQIPGLKKFWITALDDRVRPSHVSIGRKTNPADGGVPIPVDRDFVLRGTRGNERAKGPHDPRLSAGNVVHCRCRLGFVVDEKTRIGQEEGILL